ncbi:hypothetical protein HGA91_00785 [candidate division WWE3 bacterium]|nr:hypothetical protein [candidate division WWE3 bacterium]
MRSFFSTAIFIRTLFSIAVLLFVLWLTLLLGIKVDWHGDGDVAIGAVQQMLKGGKLYVDFYQFWMPVNYYLLLVWFSIWGVTTTAFATLVTIITLLSGVLVFLISYKCLKSVFSASISLLIYNCVSITSMYNHNWTGILASVIVVWVILYYKRFTNTELGWLIIGTLTGIVASIILWQGAAVFVSLIILIWTNYRFSRRSLYLSFILTVGSILVPLAWVAFFLFNGRLFDFLSSTILFPFYHYLPGNGLQLLSPLWVATFIVLIVFWKQWWHEGRKQDDLFVVSIFGTVFLLFTLMSPTLGHVGLTFAFNSNVFYSVIRRVDWLNTIKDSVIKKGRFDWSSFKNLSSNLFLSMVLIFCGLLLFICLLSKIKYYYFIDTIRITTPRGGVWVDKEWGNNINELKNILDEEPLLVQSLYIGPWLGEVYFWFDLSNPTKMISTGPEFLDPKYENELINTLKDRSIETVFYTPTYKPLPEQQLTVFNEYLSTNYIRVTSLSSKENDSEEISKLNGVWRLK